MLDRTRAALLVALLLPPAVAAAADPAADAPAETAASPPADHAGPAAGTQPPTEPAAPPALPTAAEPVAPAGAASVVPPVRPSRVEVRRPATVEVGRREPPRWRGEPISLSLRDAPLPEVLRTFAKLAGVNLVLDPRVQGTVTVELVDVPWDQALAVILKTHGMAAEVDGRVWLVTPR